MFRAVSRAGVAGIVGCALVVGAAAYLTGTVVHAQQQFQLFVAAINETTHEPAADLTAGDIIMTESGEPGRVVRLEPYRLPVRLTILVDNSAGGSGMVDTFPHFRRALESLLHTLPGDLETDVLAMAPNPRWLVRPTTDRVELMRSVQLMTPEAFPARFADALAEYSTRLERDFRGEAAQAQPPYMPVLVVISTTGLDASESRRDHLMQMLERFVKFGVRTHFAMVSRRGDEAGLELAEGSQIFVARAVQDLTKGQYEALAISSRVPSLVEEWGKQIAMTHRAGTNQYRVTLERPRTASGPLNELAMFVNREGYYGVVTADGRVP